MKALLVLLLLQQPEPTPAQVVREHADKALKAEDLEAANVLYSIAAWMKDEEAAKAEKEVADKLRAATAFKRATLDLSALTDSPWDALVATIPSKTKAARTAPGGILINFDGEKITLKGTSVSRKRERPGEFDLERFFITSDDEILLIDKSSAKVIERKPPGGLGGKLLKAADTPTLVAGEMLFQVRSVIRALQRLNDHRRAAGQAPAAFSAEISYGAFLHARYLVFEDRSNVQGMAVHNEVPGKWSSDEGAIAGRRSDISLVNLDASIDQLMATLYHRIPLIAPELKSVGIGTWENGGTFYSVIDITGGKGTRDTKTPFMYPGDGQVKVPRVFAVGETPDPRPQGLKENVGYPITITGAAPDAIGELKEEKGGVVECFVSSSKAPANPARPDNADSICLLPKKALKANTKYVVTVKYGDSSWTWSFTTK